MILELENLFRNDGEVVKLSHTLDFSGRELGGLYPFVSPVTVTGEMRNEAGVVSMHAQACVDYSAPCDRCAAPVLRRLCVPMEHLLAYELQNEENDTFLLVENMRMDLDAFVWEELLLSLPAKFLCQPDCKGLCPTCGKNLNEGPCSCKKAVDPRLEVLQQLLDN